MRIFFTLALLAAFVATALAWTKEDHEIFDLVSAVEASEGAGTTFYSWLGVKDTASVPEISKAYRKKSMQLHPDKNPGVKGIQERFARLGVVAAILRNAENRQRYDFFYKNGVPKWRGTGYYYSRFRPGLKTVFTFLILLTSGLQYVVQRMTYNKDVAIVERTIRDARSAAWGASKVPSQTRRKVKINLGGPPRLDADGNLVGGKMIELVVETNGDVFIPQPDGELIPVDASAATPPSFLRTWFISLITSLVQRATGRSASPDPAPDATVSETPEESDESETAGSGSVTPSYDSERADGDGSLKAGHSAAVKAGGKRRKAVRKRQ